MTRPTCERCSASGMEVTHGQGTICTRDPEYVVNVIAQHFRDTNPTYVGIVWEAIGNGVLQALGWRAGTTVTIGPDGRVERVQ